VDLETGRYFLHFTGNWTAITIVHSAVGLALNKRLPFTGGHYLRPISSVPVRFNDGSGYLMLELELEGFPWPLLLAALAVIGGGLFTFLSLTKVERIVAPAGSTGSILLLLALAGAVGFAGYKLVRST